MIKNFVDVGDAAIYYEIAGHGRPIVLLHGFALNSLMWEFQVPVLAQQYQVIAVDLRGFGRSSCGGRWAPEIIATDIMALIQHLRINHCAILGFSMSGPIAIRLSLMPNSAVSHLLLVSSILPSADGWRFKRKEEIEWEMELLTKGGVVRWAEEIGLMHGPLVDNMFQRNPRIADLWPRIIARHDPRCLKEVIQVRSQNNRFSGGRRPADWPACLGKIRQPTLIVAGAQDSAFIDASRYLHRHIAGSELEVISGADHMVNLEKPQEFNQVVLDFLQKTHF